MSSFFSRRTDGPLVNLKIDSIRLKQSYIYRTNASEKGIYGGSKKKKQMN